MKGRVLIVAGSDSGGGAGVQADVKTVTALGGFAATAITALTAQNTRGVFGVFTVPPAFIAKQMEVVLDDIGADCVKTGMLHDAAVIDAVADVLEGRAEDIPLVVDPVMYAKGGESLIRPDAVSILEQRLLPMATVLTPNLLEAAALSGQKIRTVEDQIDAARCLRRMGPDAVLLKGGRASGETLVDVLATENGEELFQAERFDSRNTHGTGCTLASAISQGIASGLTLRAAVTRALRYVREAIEFAPNLGLGHGPLNHGFTVRPFPD